MPVIKEPQAEPISGYRLIEPIGSGGFGEVWKCEAPGGLFKAIKFVHGNLNGLEADRTQAEEELRAIQRIKTIRHPFLLSMDRVECIDGELMIVSELADRNLYDVFREYQSQGQPGIPRAELLRYLTEAAEVLDLINIEYQLQHLDIKPRNIFLVRKHVKVADFGLVNSMCNGTGLSLSAVTPLYAAPEVFHGKLSPHCDQYSLAIVFMELLVGKLPFAGKNSRQLLMQHCAAEPDLTGLPEADKAIVSKALAKDPKQRFMHCTELVDALTQATSEDVSLTARTPPLAKLPPTERTPAEAPPPPQHDAHTALAGPDTQQLSVVNAPAFPGFRFVKSLGSNQLFDAWEVHDEDKKPRVLRFLYGFTGRDAKTLETAAIRLGTTLHPGLAPCSVIRRERGQLVLLSDPVGVTLKDRFQKCQSQGQPGVPRQELLGYLRSAAETLDYLYAQHDLHHLCLQPRLLALHAGRTQIIDFGLAQLVWLPAGQTIPQATARYSAPEFLDKQIGRGADQYSLALIYQEMLNGTYPFAASQRQGRERGQPDLSKLPESDRAAIARALDADPNKRWPSCVALIAALEGAKADARKTEPIERDRFAKLVDRPISSASLELPPETTGALNEIISKLLASAGAGDESDTNGEPINHEGELRHQFRAGLPVGAARLKLDACRAQWYGQSMRDEGNTYAFHVSMPSTFWRKWIGRQPGLEVNIELIRPHPLTPTPIDVTVTIRPFRCRPARSAKLIEELGEPILDSIQKCLLVNAEKRTQDRLLWPYPLTIRPLAADGTAGPPLECRGKDISLTGIGFYLPHELATSKISVELPGSDGTEVSLPATLVRAQRCADGWYDVGALFSLAKSKQTRKKGKK